jgi:hypothetical protein
MQARKSGKSKGMLLLGAFLAIACLAAPSAQADHHLIYVREVHRGATTANDYIVLQMYADGQNVALNTHYIDILDSTGMASAEYPLPNVASGASQRTILIGNTGVAGADFNNAGVAIPGNGAVCYDETNGYNGTGGLDCVAWGSFTGTTHPLSSPGLPVALPGLGLATNQSLVRTISRGCATLLDSADDTNNSAADFALGTPIGRNNSTAPTEKACTGGGGGTSGDPNTKIKKRPKNKSDDTSPTFKFKSTEAGSTFKCKLDHKKFRKCKSPKTYHGLDPGKHKFKVEAIDAAGNVDSTPAKDKFKVLP